MVSSAACRPKHALGKSVPAHALFDPNRASNSLSRECTSTDCATSLPVAQPGKEEVCAALRGSTSPTPRSSASLSCICVVFERRSPPLMGIGIGTMVARWSDEELLQGFAAISAIDCSCVSSCSRALSPEMRLAALCNCSRRCCNSARSLAFSCSRREMMRLCVRCSCCTSAVLAQHVSVQSQLIAQVNPGRRIQRRPPAFNAGERERGGI
mmetsp:Transcript_1190/g.2737  ORF Transcript_1190/g.2737 Transcript_1190/m.2737 type:complete len:211 (-) Transcript_1190:98-730(-)